MCYLQKDEKYFVNKNENYRYASLKMKVIYFSDQKSVNFSHHVTNYILLGFKRPDDYDVGHIK